MCAHQQDVNISGFNIATPVQVQSTHIMHLEQFPLAYPPELTHYESMNQKSDILISVVVLSQHLLLSPIFASFFLLLLFRHCVRAPHLTHILKPKYNTSSDTNTPLHGNQTVFQLHGWMYN